MKTAQASISRLQGASFQDAAVGLRGWTAVPRRTPLIQAHPAHFTAAGRIEYGYSKCMDFFPPCCILHATFHFFIINIVFLCRLQHMAVCFHCKQWLLIPHQGIVLLHSSDVSVRQLKRAKPITVLFLGLKGFWKASAVVAIVCPRQGCIML